MKKQIIINITLGLMAFAPAYLPAQTPAIDSLNRLIRTETDNNIRIQHMLAKADHLAIINLDSAISYNLIILEESKRAHFNTGQEEALSKLVYNYSYQGNSSLAQKQLNELKLLAYRLKDSGTFANYYASAGIFYGMQSKYDSSIYFYEKAIPLYEKIGNQERTAQSASNLAIGFQQQSNYPKALYYQQKSLKIQEETGNISGEAYTVVNMANTYHNMGDNQRAENYFLRAIKLAKIKHLINVELYAYTNLSGMFLNLKLWQKAYDYGMEAAKLGKQMGDKGIEAASLSKAAVAKANQQAYDKAMALSQQAVTLADTVKQPIIMQQAYSSMGFVLKSQKKWKQAIPYYETAMASFKNADMFIEENGSIYMELSECYENIGNSAKALELYKQYTLVADSVHNRNNIQKATELTMNYEFEKKEQAKKVKQDAIDELNRIRMIALGSGLILSLIIIIGAAIGYRGKQRANIQLKNQKNEIERAMLQLKEAQSQLIQSEKMASLGELTAGIAHEIQNPLNFVNNFSEVSIELIDEMKEQIQNHDEPATAELADKVANNLEKIIHHGHRADSIVKGMLLHSRSSSGIKEPTDINHLADEFLRLAFHGIRAKDPAFNGKIETDYDNSIQKINIIPQDMGRVILNLITNAFYATNMRKKQSDASYVPTVKIQTRRLNGKVEIKVTDNGTGISEKDMEKIFQPFFTTKPAGEGTGLGLSMSYDIVTGLHEGKLLVKSKTGEGTSMIIILPYN
ncbi:MAG: tetratricopeptide repeat protein, partial [Lentimicrobiaceae bacterium]|nr:tetratricopeptide repeat protein [Lentimicrobiaceae bacterium]